MKTFAIQSRDVLFFRDARPLGGSAEGAGADWPLPSVLHTALLSAFHHRWPDGTEWESRHIHWTEREQKKFANGATSSMRFGGLRIIGPFPHRSHPRKPSEAAPDAIPAGVYFPTPSDLLCGGVMQPVRNTRGATNLPSPLRHPVASPLPPTKEKPGFWTPRSEYIRYLRGENDIRTVDADALYITERRPGVGIDPETHANRKSVFYQAEYLRLLPGVQFVFQAQAAARAYNQKEGADLLDCLLQNENGAAFVFGGQRGVAFLRELPSAKIEFDLPHPEPPTQRIKWILLSPALFDHGWRPDWVGDDGNVLLRDLPDRTGFPTRKAWREAARDAPAIAARLVAARIPKPVAASGWKLAVDGRQQEGPKPTRLLVPAGAVYYFECDDEAAAKALVRQLHLKVKSQRLGEKGFGFGVCGTWEFLNVGENAVTT